LYKAFAKKIDYLPDCFKSAYNKAEVFGTTGQRVVSVELLGWFNETQMMKLQSERCDQNYSRLAMAMEEERVSLTDTVVLF